MQEVVYYPDRKETEIFKISLKNVAWLLIIEDVLGVVLNL